MEFYNQPSHNTYVPDRFRWFQMPLGDGRSQMVAAVTTREANYWIIAYTIFLTSSFAAVAKLVNGFVLTYAPLRGRGNRHVVLVTFFNAGSPLAAATQMIQYVSLAVGGSRRAGKWAVNWDTLRFASILCSIAVANIAASQVSKFVVGGDKLVIRHAARANPSAMFYPARMASLDLLAYQLVQPVRASAAFQALGRFESSKANVGKVVKVTSTNGSSAAGPTFQLEYSYTITGADFGLQLASELHFDVVGHCETRWDWVERFSNITDGYPLWGFEYAPDNPVYDNANVDAEKDSPPWLNIVPSNDTSEAGTEGRGYEFALVPNVSHRKSYSPNTFDPWYMTEDNPPDPLDLMDAPYRVRRARPPVFCYQNDTWSLGNKRVHRVDDLNTLSGLKLSSFIRDILFPTELRAPAIIQTGNNLGRAQLSQVLEQATNIKAFNAERCNVARDVERLVQISYIASREIVRNTVLLYPTLQGQAAVRNAAEVNGVVPDEFADFILETKDVAALSVSTLLFVPIICIFLWSIVLIRENPICGMMRAKNTGALSRHNLRMIALRAAQLYRYLDEQISGKRRWSGRATMTPFIQDIQDDCPGDDRPSKEEPPVSVGGRVSCDHDTTSPFIQDDCPEDDSSSEEGLPVSAGGRVSRDHDTTSPFIKPKLVRAVGGPSRASLSAPPSDKEARADGDGAGAGVADADVKGANPNEYTRSARRVSFLDRMMFWRESEDLDKRFELVMTRRWQQRLKPNDHFVEFDEILDDLPPRLNGA